MTKTFNRRILSAFIGAALCLLAVFACFAFAVPHTVSAEEPTTGTTLTLDTRDRFIVDENDYITGFAEGVADTFATYGEGNVIIHIPDGIKGLETNCFGSSSVKKYFGELTIPKSVTYIGRNVMAYFKNAKKLEILANVDTLDSKAIMGADNLVELTIPFVGLEKDAVKASSSTVFGAIFSKSSTAKAGYNNVIQLYSLNKNDYDQGSFFDDNTYLIPQSLKKVTVLGGNVLFGAFGSGSATAHSYGSYEFLEEPIFDVAKLTDGKYMPFDTLVLGKDVSSVGDYAFFGDKDLGSINKITAEDVQVGISISGISIGNSALTGTAYLLNSLKTVETDDAVYKYSNNSLYSVEPKNPETFTTIKIEAVVDGKNITSVEKDAFAACGNVTDYIVPEGFSIDVSSLSKDANFYVYGSNVTADNVYSYLRITDTKKSINRSVYTGKLSADGAFDAASFALVTQLVIPEGIVEADNMIAYNNAAVTDLVLPTTLRKITVNNFNKIKNIRITSTADFCKIDFSSTNYFYNRRIYVNDKLVKYTDKDGNCDGEIDFVVSGDVENIGSYTLNIMADKVIIEEGVKTLGQNILGEYATYVKEVVLPDSLTSIGRYAFYNCTTLEKVYISKESNIQTIEEKAFYNCTALTEITLPKVLQSISTNTYLTWRPYPGMPDKELTAFNKCTNLHTIYNYSDLKLDFGYYTNGFVAQYAKRVITENGTIEVTDADDDGYVFMKDGVANVNYLYRYSGSATQLTLPVEFEGKSYTIHRQFMSNNNNITSLTILDGSVDEIQEQAFYSCSNLRQAFIAGVENIGSKVFQWCSGLESVAITGAVKTISDQAFAQCTKLKNVTVNDSGLVSIGAEAFAGAALEKLILPSTVEVIGPNAFSSNRALKEVKLNENLKYIGNNAFRATDLTSVTIPASVIAIGSAAFEICYNLKTVIFAENSKLEALGYAVFDRTAIERIELPDSVQIMANYMFDRCQSLEYVKMPTSLKSGSVFTIKDEGKEYYDYIAIRYDGAIVGENYAHMYFGFTPNLKTVYLPAVNNTANDFLTYCKDNNESSCIYVAPDKSSYDYILTKGNDGVKTFFATRLYYETEVTFNVVKSTDVLAHATETKLVTDNDGGASIKFVKNNGVWAIDDGYTLPTSVGLYGTDNWTYGDDVALDLNYKINTANCNDLTFTYALSDGTVSVTLFEKLTAQYTGSAWVLPNEYKDILSVVKVDGIANGTAVNVGDYKVSVVLADGYAWSDGETGEKTFDLHIAPKEIEVQWNIGNSMSYTGNDVLKEIKVTYGNETLMYVVAYALDGENKTVTDSVVVVGKYSFEILESYYPNYIILNAVHEFEITTGILSVTDDVMANLSIDLEGNANLSSGLLYIYEDGNGKSIPSYTQLGADYRLIEIANVESSIARYINSQLAIGAKALNDVNVFDIAPSNTTGNDVGIYNTVFTLTAKQYYMFDVFGGFTDSAKGLNVVVAPNGKTLTITKTWYIVQLANEIVKATFTGADEPTDDDLYTVSDWTYGQDVSFTLPKLWHGSEADNANHVTFALNRQGDADAIVSGAARADLLKYLNKYMPAGNYSLIFTVAAFDTADASYPTFSRRYEFTVAKAAIGIDESKLPKDEMTGYASYEWELTANANKELFFKAFADKINAEGVLQTVVMDAPTDTFWGKPEGKAYFGEYTVKYNFARMNNEVYVLSNNNDILTLINGGAQGTYTVYFQVEMKNHENLTDIGKEGRYAYFFTVVVYETVDPVDIHLDNVTYTGLKNIPTLNETDVYHVEYDENDGYIDAGEHALILVLNDSVHYRWKGIANNKLEVKYTIGKALNEFIEDPDIVRWIEGKFDKKENGFIGAAKFGQISYIIKDTNNKVLYDAAKGIDKRAEMEAGTYILEATVIGNANYNGLKEAFTIKILEKVGLPWWAVLLIVLGALGVAALIIFILWKKGVFQILTEKIVVAIRTKASVDATIASVRAAKKMEEGKQSVADAKRRERIEQMRKRAAEQRALPPEERAAQLEAKAQADAERAEKIRARSEATKAKAAKLRGETPAEEPPAEAEAAATDDGEPATEE